MLYINVSKIYIYFFLQKGEIFMLLTVEVADRVDLFEAKGEKRKEYGKLKFRMATILHGDGQFAEKWFFASDVFNYLDITSEEGFNVISYFNKNRILIFTKDHRLREVQVINREAIRKLINYFGNDKAYNLIDYFLDGGIDNFDESEIDDRILYTLPHANYIK